MRIFRRLVDAAAQAATHHTSSCRLVHVLRLYLAEGKGQAEKHEEAKRKHQQPESAATTLEPQAADPPALQEQPQQHTEPAGEKEGSHAEEHAPEEADDFADKLECDETPNPEETLPAWSRSETPKPEDTLGEATGNPEADEQGSGCVTNAHQMATDDQSNTDASNISSEDDGDGEPIEWNEDAANQLRVAEAAVDTISARMVRIQQAIEELKRPPAAGWTRAGPQPRSHIQRLEQEYQALDVELNTNTGLIVDLESARDDAAASAAEHSNQQLDPYHED